jgi:Tfp pilus assembly protein PilF
MDPETDNAWYYKALALRKLVKDDEASKAYDEAIKLNPRAKTLDSNPSPGANSKGNYIVSEF